MSEDMDVLLAERAIQRVPTTCSRGVDRFERRPGEWRIEERVCAFDWRRADRVDGAGGFADGYARGLRSPDDIVHRILDPSRG
jgi:hypothetical protein